MQRFICGRRTHPPSGRCESDTSARYERRTYHESSESLNSCFTSSSSEVLVNISTAVAAKALATLMARWWLRQIRQIRQWLHCTFKDKHLRVLAPCSLLKISRMWPTTLTLNTEIRMQTRQSMRDIALIRASLCNRRIAFGNLSPKRGEVSPIRAPESSRRYVVLIGVLGWRDV
jgi:hypothetical protein